MKDRKTFTETSADNGLDDVKEFGYFLCLTRKS